MIISNLQIRISNIKKLTKELVKVTLLAKYKEGKTTYTFTTDFHKIYPDIKLAKAYAIKNNYVYKNIMKESKKKQEQWLLAREIDKKIIVNGGAKYFGYLVSVFNAKETYLL